MSVSGMYYPQHSLTRYYDLLGTMYVRVSTYYHSMYIVSPPVGLGEKHEKKKLKRAVRAKKGLGPVPVKKVY